MGITKENIKIESNDSQCQDSRATEALFSANLSCLGSSIWLLPFFKVEEHPKVELPVTHEMVAHNSQDTTQGAAKETQHHTAVSIIDTI